MPGQTLIRPWLPGTASVSASMEGRAIARPNVPSTWMSPSEVVQLQWRAGQLPGQTRTRSDVQERAPGFNGGPGNCPAKQAARSGAERLARAPASMEGRAIARPNGSQSG